MDQASASGPENSDAVTSGICAPSGSLVMATGAVNTVPSVDVTYAISLSGAENGASNAAFAAS